MSSFNAFPIGWHVKEIADADITIIDGDRGANYPSKDEFANEGYCLFLNTGNIKNDCFDFSSCDFITENKDALLRKGKLRRKDVVLTTRGTVGSVGFFHNNISYEHIRINSGMVVLRCAESVSPYYSYHLFKSPLLKTQYSLYSSGAAQPQLPIKDLKRIKLPIPPLSVQEKIAAILSAYDELIENNQRRIVLLEKIAEEVYREWFVRLRFPGHDKVKVIKGVPEGWKLVKLEKAFDFTGGGTPTKEVSRYWDGGDVNWFTPSDITGANGIFLERSGNQCTEEGFNKSSAKMFPAYSVMLTSRATIGAVGINLTPACTNQGFITCIPNAQYRLSYLYHWIKLAKPHFELLSGGATFAELTKGTFKKIEILTPPEKLVEKFDELESPIFKAIERYHRQNTKLIATRDLLLPRLISGKLSVENLDIQFPPGMEEVDHAV
ncbi:MAG: restriction endonuclease subunit S [Methylobacter tundripaludum]|nr:restriction endonuclease subunit S [Methylobacter tundripaludum]